MTPPVPSPTTPPPTSGRLAGVDGWSRAAARYGIAHLRLRQVASLINDLHPASMLDVGCSSGFLRKLCPGIAYTGVDFIPPPPTPPATDAFTFHQVNLNREPLPAHLTHLELIACSGSLEYLDKLPAILTDLTARLRPGGHLVASYYNFNHISRLWTAFKGKSFWVHPDWRGLYSPADFATLLRKSGLEVVSVLPSYHALSPSPRIEETVSLPLRFPELRPWSHLLAHQFLFVARRPV